MQGIYACTHESVLHNRTFHFPFSYIYMKLISCWYLNTKQEVKVEKVGEKYLVIRVSCCKKKRQDLLVSILDAIEKLNLNVIQVRVEANYLFGLEAIVDANINGTDDQVVDVKDVNEAILNAINKCN